MAHCPRSRTAQIRVSRRADGSSLIYDSRSDAGHMLNAAATAVYELADGTRTSDQIAAWLPDRVDLPADSEIVELALQDLESAGLLEEAVPLAADMARSTASSPEISRRQLLTKVALSASAVAVLPKLVSIAGLSEAAQASPRLGGSSAIAAQEYDYYYDYDYEQA